MDLPSVLGGLAQGFVDFGKSAVDLFGTGGAAFADLIQGTGTKNQDDFRKWLYQTDSVKDAAAKGLGTALNGAQTISDYVIPGGISKSLLFNAGQGALGGLADEFKTYGENYDLGRAGQRALVSAGAAGAGTGLANALKKSGSGLLNSGLAQGASRGALSGAINQGGYATIDGGDVLNSAMQGAGMGALLGGATGAVQDFIPKKLTPAQAALTDDEKTARIANAKQMLETATTPERRAELQAQINRLGGTLENTLAADDMAVNAVAPGNKRLYRGLTQEYDPNYPTNKLDTSGYESWTDNLELARQYGENVYYIDVPEKDIKTSYLDENPMSETYGDRNPIYSIDKKAGLNGVSGNEYLLYMDDPYQKNLTYNRLPNNATLDATLANADLSVNNAKLTPEQEAYFKDSVIRDENGNLMPMYHGSRSKFTVFDSSKGGESNGLARVGHWFTPDEQGARRFADQTWYGDLDEPEVYNTYLNIKNPKVYEPIDNSAKIDALQNEISDTRVKLESMRKGTDEFNELYKHYNNLSKQLSNLSYGDPYEQFRTDVYAMEGKTPEQANVGGLGMIMDDQNAAVQKYVQGLKDQGYDGIIIKGTGYDGGTLGKSNDQYVVFDSNQIKDINNLKPTLDADIMASRMTPDEMDLARTLARQDMTVNDAGKINRIGSADVAPIDKSTLPKGWSELQAILNKDYIQDIPKSFGLDDDYLNNLTNDQLKKYILDAQDGPNQRKGWESRFELVEQMADDPKDVRKALEDAAIWQAKNKYEKAIEKLDLPFYQKNAIYGAANRLDEAWGEEKRYMDNYIEGAEGKPGWTNNATSEADAEFSDRLGIGQSHTLKQDYVPYGREAAGQYLPGEYTMAVQPYLNKENAVSTVAHERLHSFQEEAKPENSGRYNKEVIRAYNELSKDLEPFIHDEKTIRDKYKTIGNTEYWGRPREQESRMMQQYLDNKGFTKKALKAYRMDEWGNEINPAFDKFFDKLRDLSKRGVALPALAGLVGGGAVLDQILNSKDEDKKKTKRSV